jgi:general stress protein 26
MTEKSLAELSKKMRATDVAMLSTIAENGAIAGRPMSHNGEVEYDGDSYYFTWDQSRTVADIERQPTVSLSFQGAKAFLAAVEGKASRVRYWDGEDEGEAKLKS